MSSIRRIVGMTAGASILWVLLATWVIPRMIEIAYGSAILPASPEVSLGFILGEWYEIAFVAPLAAAAVLAFVRLLHSPEWARRIVPDARPSDLGAIRILVCSVLLISTLWEQVASSAYIPRSLLDPPGLMQLLYALPISFERFAASAAALTVFEWLTAAVLLCGVVGYRTKLVLPLGAVLYFVLGGLLRQYAWFYHTGLLCFYLLVVLCFVPCHHGLSLDRWLRVRRDRTVAPDIPSPVYGWGRYALWTVFALPYVAAGLSKLRNGGLDWWDASNFKFILFQSTLRPMQFDFDWSLRLASAPDVVFETLALSAVLGELLYGLVLFSRRARWVLPSAMLLMHVGIVFLQNILFFDLILLQLIYFNFRPALARLLRSSAALRRGFSGLIARGTPSVPSSGIRGPGPRFVTAIVSLLVVCWIFRVEYYPFTGMQMFSGKRSEPVVYERAIARTSSGDEFRAPIEKSIPAMSDSRYRRVLAMSFKPERTHIAQSFFEVVVQRWNESAPEELRIDQIEVQQWEWNFLSEPDDPTYGRVVNSVVYSFDTSG